MLYMKKLLRVITLKSYIYVYDKIIEVCHLGKLWCCIWQNYWGLSRWKAMLLYMTKLFVLQTGKQICSFWTSSNLSWFLFTNLKTLLASAWTRDLLEVRVRLLIFLRGCSTCLFSLMSNVRDVVIVLNEQLDNIHGRHVYHLLYKTAE